MKFKNINIDRSPLTPEDIAKANNFDALLKAHAGVPVKSAKPWYKSTGFIGTVSTLVVGSLIAGAVVLYQQSESTNPITEQPTEQSAIAEAQKANEIGESKSVINPPFGDIMDRESFKVDAVKGGTMEVKNSVLHVPENAFVDADGNPVTGEVDLELTEYHNPDEIMASGIPMIWMEGKEEMHFESGGMIELRGSQNGEEIFIAEGKSIDVEMSTDVPTFHKEFNSYVLNEETGEWIDLGEMKREAQRDSLAGEIPVGVYSQGNEAADELIALGSEVEEWYDGDSSSMSTKEALKRGLITKEEASAISNVEKHKKKKPVEPKLMNEVKQQMALSFNEKDFPELSGYSDVLWEVEPKDFDQEQSNKEWNEAKIIKGSRDDEYVITFIRPGDRYSVSCYPVVPPGKEAEAKEVFEKKLEAYNKTLEELEAKKAAEEKKRKEAMAEAREAAKRRREQQILAQERYTDSQMTMSTMTNFFSVTGFGVYNCDRPSGVPRGQKYSSPRFFVDGQEQHGFQYHMTDSRLNAAILIFPGKPLQYNPSSKTHFYAAHGKNLLIASPADVEKRSSKQCDVEMHRYPKEIKSVSDIKLAREWYDERSETM